MFSRLIPKRYHHLSPEYQAFTLIVAKPNENFVEPKRAARRVRQCMAILIYAQQWINEVVDASTILCPVDVTRSLTRIVEILSDRNASWNANGQIMRPANLLLDCFGALYESLNCLQRTIKDLTGRPVYLAQNRATKCLIGTQFAKIRTTIAELLAVMEAMPRRKAGAISNIPRQALIDHGDEDETNDTVDIRFGFTLSNASLEELNQIKHRSVSVMARERKRSRMAASLKSTSQSSLGSVERLELQESSISVMLDEKDVLAQHLENADQKFLAPKPVDIQLDQPCPSSAEKTSTSLGANGSNSSAPREDTEADLTTPRDGSPAMLQASEASSSRETEQDARSLDEAVEATLARWSQISGESAESSPRSTMFSMADSDDSSESLTLVDTRGSIPQISEADAALIKNAMLAHQLGRGLERPVVSTRTRRPESILTGAPSSSRTDRPRRASATARSETTRVLYKFPRPCSSLGAVPPVRPARAVPDAAMLKRYRLVSDATLPAQMAPPTSPLPDVPSGGADSVCAAEGRDLERGQSGLLRLDKTQRYALSELAHLQTVFGPRLERVDVKARRRDFVAQSRVSSQIAYDGRHWCFA